MHLPKQDINVNDTKSADADEIFGCVSDEIKSASIPAKQDFIAQRFHPPLWIYLVRRTDLVEKRRLPSRQSSFCMYKL